MLKPRKNGSCADPILAGQIVKMIFAIRHSPFAIRQQIATRQQAGAAS
jgi:hypothetical protein